MTNSLDSNEKIFADEVDRITATFCAVLDIEHVDPTDNFFRLGGDSFDAIRVMSGLGAKLPIVALFEHPTAEELARYILSKVNRQSSRLIPLHDETLSYGSIAVVCVPYGGGDPTTYRDLFRRNLDVRVFGVDFGDLEIEGASDFSALLHNLVAAIEKIDADQLIIYGHCAGAAMAACIASAVASTDSSLSLVVAASRPIEDPDTAIRQAEGTSDSEWTQYLRSLGAFTGLVDSQIDAMQARGRRDHLIAAEAYRSLAQHPTRGVPALVLFGDEDPATPQSGDIVAQWRRLIDVAESTSLASGGHYFVRTHVCEVEEIVLSFAARNKQGKDTQ